MKSLLPLIVISTILVGCGGQHLLSTTNSQDQDIFSEESFVRYGGQRLKEMETHNDIRVKELARCYQGKTEEALHNLSLKMDEFKNDPLYWNQIGTCYSLIKNNYKAEYFYNLSISVAKTNKKTAPFAYNNLGLIYLSENNSKKAFELFQEALKINTRLLTPRFNLAQVYLQYGKSEDAFREVSTLFRLNPKDNEIIQLMGLTLLMNNKPADALSYYERLPELMTRREDIAAYYSYTLYLNGQFEKAKSVLSKQSLPTIAEIRQVTNQVNKLLEIEFERQRVEKKLKENQEALKRSQS